MKREQITPAMLRLMSPEDRKKYDRDFDLIISDTIPECYKKAALDIAISGKAEGFRGASVRFTLFRVRPLDPDNAAASTKDLLDGLRHAALIPGDEPWRIRFEVTQEKVNHFRDEKTVIAISDGLMGLL